MRDGSWTNRLMFCYCLIQFVVNYNMGYSQPLKPKHNVASHLNVLLTVLILFKYLSTLLRWFEFLKASKRDVLRSIYSYGSALNKGITVHQALVKTD